MANFRSSLSTYSLLLTVMLQFCRNSDACRSIFSSGKSFFPPDPKTQYVGCFADKKDDRDLRYQAESSSEVMSLANCNDQCRLKGATYYGAQAGTECFCGSSYGRHGPAVDDAFCDRSCIGQVSKNKVFNAIKAQDKCGGDLFNSVYVVQGDKPGQR